MKTIKTMVLILLLFVSADLLFAGNEVQERTQSFSVSKGGALIVNVNPGDIIISVWEKNEVQIKVKGLDEDELDDLEMKMRDNKVYIDYDSDWGGSHNAKFYVLMPSQFDVDIRTTGGDIDIKGNLKGKLEISTSGGDIDFNDVVGEVNVNTSGGDIKCGDVQGRVRMNTMGGDIRIGRVKAGDAKVTTMGGDIKVGDIDSDLTVKTYGGDIEVGNVGGSASVETYGGDIIIKNVSGSVDMSTYGGDLSLKSASGIIKANTYGGNITLENITGSVDAKTAAGRIYVELNPSGKGRSRLKTSAGEIKLVIPASAKVTIEAEIEIDGRWKSGKREYKVYSDFTAKSYVTDDDERIIKAVYELNGGGELITLETVNSDIRIVKSR
ncbi:MAG: hypothetical protein A2V66_06195 [Ignavibacteria bacterium RBG_13_36_8]|nr:MAG: hypothetical protein A2V66_06195 [Ignavibacteria bacterium RBG_13_36_8]